MKRPLKFPLKFEKGIRFITGKRTATEARKAFKDFYLFKLRHFQKARWGAVDEQLAQKRLAENIEGFQEKGFEKAVCEGLKRDYQQLPRRAPRKRVKKEVDANGIPKVTKTPLGPQLSALLKGAKVTKIGRELFKNSP